mgnify:CR=1 FL=1
MELEKSKGTQVLEQLETSEELELPCHLILLDDDSHTYAYVIAMLTNIFGYSREKGFAIASTVDSQGQAIGDREQGGGRRLLSGSRGGDRSTGGSPRAGIQDACRRGGQ